MTKPIENKSFAVTLPAQFHSPPSQINMAKFRSERFEKVLKSYMLSKGNAWCHGTGQSWLADLMADALHFCEVNGINADFALKLARSHFENEKLDDVKQAAFNVPKASAPTSAIRPY